MRCRLGICPGQRARVPPMTGMGSSTLNLLFPVGFLTLGSVDILEWLSLCVGGCPALWWAFSRIGGLRQLVAICTAPYIVKPKNVSIFC